MLDLSESVRTAASLVASAGVACVLWSGGEAVSPSDITVDQLRDRVELITETYKRSKSEAEKNTLAVRMHETLMANPEGRELVSAFAEVLAREMIEGKGKDPDDWTVLGVKP